MKRAIVVLGLVLFVGYAAVDTLGTVCDTSGSVTGASRINCPDGMEPHRASQRYHGWTFATGGGVECASGMCIDFSGEVVAYHQDEAGWQRCGDFMAGIPNEKHGLCTADGGWVTLWWDGVTVGGVCVDYDPE